MLVAVEGARASAGSDIPHKSNHRGTEAQRHRGTETNGSQFGEWAAEAARRKDTAGAYAPLAELDGPHRRSRSHELASTPRQKLR